MVIYAIRHVAPYLHAELLWLAITVVGGDIFCCYEDNGVFTEGSSERNGKAREYHVLLVF